MQNSNSSQIALTSEAAKTWSRVNAVAQPPLKAKVTIKRITPLINTILDMITNGKTEAQIIQRTGVQSRFIARMFSSSAVKTEYERRIEEIRTGARARNILAAIAIRDKVLPSEDNPTPDFTAAQATAALKAAEFLHGEAKTSGVSVNIGSINQISAGYVVDLRPDQLATRISNPHVIERKPLKTLIEVDE